MEGRTPSGLVLERGRFVTRLGHQEESSHGVQVEHGRLQLGQLDGSDAHSPDIAEVVVTTLPFHGSNFWCHPVRRSDEALPFSQSGCYLGEANKY